MAAKLSRRRAFHLPRLCAPVLANSSTNVQSHSTASSIHPLALPGPWLFCHSHLCSSCPTLFPTSFNLFFLSRQLLLPFLYFPLQLLHPTIIIPHTNTNTDTNCSYSICTYTHTYTCIKEPAHLHLVILLERIHTRLSD